MMVSKESIKRAIQEERNWRISHPRSTQNEILKHRILNTPHFIKESLEMDIRLATLPSMFVFMPKPAIDKIQAAIDKRKKWNDKAESPIAIIVTIMISIILMIGVMFAMGNFLDGFMFIMNKLPVGITSPILQHSMTKLMYLATIFFAIPSIFTATLIVWGIKSIIRKHGYTRTGDEYYIEEF
jgi:hypothetical protein